MRSLKLILIILAISLIVSCQSESKIPANIGHWRVEVGPAGNEYYEGPSMKEKAIPPSENLLAIVRTVAPPHMEVKQWELDKKDLYIIQAEAGPEEYEFDISTGGKIIKLQYDNDSTNVEEEAGELILKGKKKQIAPNEVPTKALETIDKVIPNARPDQTWVASTVAGKRYVIVVNDLVFYARPDGQIQAIGLVEDNALNEIDPPEKTKKKTDAVILAEARKAFYEYKDYFNFEKRIKQLGKRPKSKDGRFRFVVIGDSRSNPDLWVNIVKHIDLLDPKPDFVMNTGDIVPHGYVKEYLEYYIPPLIKINFAFFVAIGNHDDGANARAIEYRELFGKNSLNYYFDYGKFRFVFVDNCTKVRSYDKTIDWLENVLAGTPKDHSIIVAAHKPVATVEKWAYHSWDKKNSVTFHKLMCKYEVDHVFFGHIHAYSTATLDGISYTVSGGGGAGLHDRYGPMGNVHHYLICDVQPDGTVKQRLVRFYNE